MLCSRTPTCPPALLLRPALQFAVAGNLIKKQGVGSLYKGLSAGLLRQATYTTARLGIYNNIYEAALAHNDNKVGAGAMACGRAPGGEGEGRARPGGGEGVVFLRCLCGVPVLGAQLRWRGLCGWAGEPQATFVVLLTLYCFLTPPLPPPPPLPPSPCCCSRCRCGRRACAA